jgi:hypothetical protein
MLIRIRARYAMKKLAPLKIFFRRKLEQIRSKYANMLAYEFESMVYSSKTIMLVSTLKYRTLILQRNIRNFLICQNARREALKLLWQRRKNILLEAFNIGPVSALKLHIKVDSVAIPDLITTRYIQEYIRVKFQEYIEKLDEYQMYCEYPAKFLIPDSEIVSKIQRSIPVYDIYTKSDLLDSLIKEAYTRRISDKRKNTIAPVRSALTFLR